MLKKEYDALGKDEHIEKRVDQFCRWIRLLAEKHRLSMDEAFLDVLRHCLTSENPAILNKKFEFLYAAVLYYGYRAEPEYNSPLAEYVTRAFYEVALYFHKDAQKTKADYGRSEEAARMYYMDAITAAERYLAPENPLVETIDTLCWKNLTALKYGCEPPQN